MILSDIWAEAGRLLADANNGRWDTGVLTARANLAQTEIQGYTNAVKSSETITPVALQRAYTLDADTMDVIRANKVLTDGSIRPFNGYSRDALDYLYQDWQQWQAGEPLVWYYDSTNQQINVAPVPDAGNAAAGTWTFYEVRKPADMVNSTDIPFDSNNQMIPYHMAIVHWVVAQCWLDDGTPEAIAKANYHRSGDMSKPGLYEQQLKRINDKFENPEAIQDHILCNLEGGRKGLWGPSKSYPLS